MRSAVGHSERSIIRHSGRSTAKIRNPGPYLKSLLDSGLRRNDINSTIQPYFEF